MRHPWRFAGFLTAFRAAVTAQLRESPPSLVHAHWWFPSAWVTFPIASRAIVPKVLSIHGTDMRLLGRVWPQLATLLREATGAVLTSDAVQALDRLARDPALADRLGRAARNRALRGTPDPLAARLAALYAELIGSAP